MPRPGFSRLDPEEQTRLLDLAADRFAAEGFGTSYNGIIEASGLSKGSMYHYFESKADLFAAVFERELGGWMAVIASVPLDEASPSAWWVSWRAIYGQVFVAMVSQPRSAGILRAYLGARSEPGLQGIRDRIEVEIGAWMLGVLARGQALGAVRRDVPEDLLLSAIMALGEATDTWLFSRWASLDRDGREEALDQVVRLLRDAASPPCD